VQSLITPEEDIEMSWTKPVLREIECGMEINMYGPEGEEREHDDLF
jgi:coenzyme PQQ precursor peptide PqqA